MHIAIIGCGTIGKAIAEKLAPFHTLHLYNKSYEKAAHLEKLGVGVSYKDCLQAIQNAKVILIAVKPQNINEVAQTFGKKLKKSQVVISLLAGVSLTTLHELFPKTTILRMMPNLALLHGKGLLGISSREEIPQKEKTTLLKLFEPLGTIYFLPENKINGLTALTGSGPAFFFALIEAMIDSGIAMGFNSKDAQTLVYHMLQGGLSLLQESKAHPGELKWQIASPQGTTIAGLQKLEELALRGGIINTFLAAYQRAQELDRR